MRYDALRSVYSAFRWQTNQILHALRRPDRWARRVDSGRPGAARATASHPGRVLAGARSVVWFLHTGDAHDRLCPLAAQSRPDRKDAPSSQIYTLSLHDALPTIVRKTLAKRIELRSAVVTIAT